MAPILDVESKDHLDDIVKNREKIVVCCLPCPPQQLGANDNSSSKRDDPAALYLNELAQRLETVTPCRIDVATHPNLRPVVAELLAGGEERRDGNQSETGWIFFRAGCKALTAPGSTPWPRLSRLISLLESNPDTFDQLARQEHVNWSSRSRATSATDRPEAAEEDTAAANRSQASDRLVETRVAIGRSPAVCGSAGASPMGEEESSGGSLPPALVFVAGDRSQVGKSSTCLALLGSLLGEGYQTGELAYIKPATQCETPQLVTEWCERRGIACKGIGPVVFYKGFTREFLKGGLGTSEELIQEIRDAVRKISFGKKIVVVDGVGYPAVGSICGVSNGNVALALRAPVLLVGKSGVGDAVDSFNLNACFFEYQGVRVLGGVFNRISTSGYYSLERCREAVNSYFSQARPDLMPYGFVPEIASLGVKAGTSSPKTPSPAAAGGVSVEGSDKGAARSLPPVPAVPLPVTSVDSEEDLRAFLGKGRLVLVDFWADWCKGCKTIAPFVRGLPTSFNGGIAVATVNVDEAPDVAEEWDVTSLPHFILFEDGAQVEEYTGSSETELQEKLRRHSAGSGTVGGTTRGGSGISRQGDGDGEGQRNSGRLEAAEVLIEAFRSNVDVSRLLRDILEHARIPSSNSLTSSRVVTSTTVAVAAAVEIGGAARAEADDRETKNAPGGDETPRTPGVFVRSREEIEGEAEKQGASGG